MKFTHKGFVYHEYAHRSEVFLKEGKLHWIDSDKNRWRKSNGRLAGNETMWPRLSLPTVHTIPKDKPDKALRLTHEGRVVVFGKGGIGSLYKLRETKLFWVDSNGVKYRKDEGWSVPTNSHRLQLSTVTKITRTRVNNNLINQSRAK